MVTAAVTELGFYCAVYGLELRTLVFTFARITWLPNLAWPLKLSAVFFIPSYTESPRKHFKIMIDSDVLCLTWSHTCLVYFVLKFMEF